MKKERVGIIIVTLMMILAVIAAVGNQENEMTTLLDIEENDMKTISLELGSVFDQYQEIKNENLQHSKTDDVIDQQQTTSDDSLVVLGMRQNIAQSFKPTLDRLTKIEIRVKRVGSPAGDLTLSIKSSLTGTDLTSLPLSSSALTTGWIEFDFSDIVIIPEQTYYIVWRPSSTWDETNHLAWSANSLSDEYNRGNGWYKLFTEWIALPDEYVDIYDFCFKTYGRLEEDQDWLPEGAGNTDVIYHMGPVGMGTAAPESELHLKATSGTIGHADFRLESIDNEQWNIGAGEKLWFAYRDASSDWKDFVSIDPQTGVVEVPVLKINGGSDIVEPFDIRDEDSAVPGMVVVIDSEYPGCLKCSDRAYDTCVAGIVSGAGGVKPGLMINQEEYFLEGGYPVALTGRVYGFCDASYGSIVPGDLLVTSPTPGHAMKVSDYDRSEGAILGKAMTGLTDGQGLVLILVRLQ
jgi:hypothetical protein